MARTRRNRSRVIHISGDVSEKNINRRVKKKASKLNCSTVRYSAVRIFRVVRAKMARAFCTISQKGSRNGIASTGQQKFIPARESHQSEDVEDCIIFMNSSSRKLE